jgi:hypothetical protein
MMLILVLSRCTSIKNMDTSNVSQVATLLSSLSSNATVQQAASPFNILGTN